MIRVFIGYDPREAIAYHVLAHSIWARASVPVSITPLKLNQLPLTRPRDPLQSTDFAFSRFLVPYLCDYQGFAIYMDCDMLCLDDIVKLWLLRDERYAVQVVQHSHKPREEIKFLGQYQSSYTCKNWSSLMLFNCDAGPHEKCVNEWPGLDLHQFKWTASDKVIGKLPSRWNHLAGYDKTPDPAIVHYTTGGPWFPEYADCEYATAWFEERERMIA